MEATAIRLQGLRKAFGETTAVAGVDLDIADGEFFSMLGPSGSGKTTVLRMIAGFESPTAGRSTSSAAGRGSPGWPLERDVHTVFQDYALFPHMTVEQNVAYGLKVRKVPKAERLQQAREALADVRLEGFGARRPSSSPAPASARRTRPRPRRAPPGAAARRAARRPRPQAAPTDAGRTQGDPARSASPSSSSPTTRRRP